MDRFQAISAFVRVVEAGSFAGAAARLDVSVSAVSRHVAQLEAHLATRLLNRTTRRLSLTEAGRAFHERSVQLLADLEEAEEAVTSAAIVPRGTLRLASSMTFGMRHLAPAIAEFSEQHPELRFDVQLSEHAIDLVDAGIDLAIRIGDIRSQALIARRIGVSHFVCCASPAYLARHGTPRTPDDLVHHRCLLYEYASDANLWRFTDRAGIEHAVRVSGPMRTNNSEMLSALAAAGTGILLEPDFIVASAIRAARLIVILPDYRPPSIDIHAVYPSRRHLSAKVRTFIDFLAARFAKNPEWGVGVNKLPAIASQRPRSSRKNHDTGRHSRS